MDNTINEIITEYAIKINRRYNTKAIYLYGSQSKGSATSYSDIDIAIIIDPTNIEKYMDILSDLFVIASDVDSRIEPNLLMDDGEDDKYSFLHEIKKTGKLIHEKGRDIKLK